MDLGITGIIDILIIVFAFIAGFIGYVKGFMNKALSIVGVILIFVFSIMFCVQLAGLMQSTGIIYDSLNKSFINRIEPVYTDGMRFAVVVEKSFKIHSAIATVIAFVFGNPKPTSAAEAAEVLAVKATTIIAFLIIFIVLSIALFVLKMIVGHARENKVVKKIDGIFGIFLYIVLYSIFLLVIFFILKLIFDYGKIDDFNNWLTVDLALDNPNKFRIGKYLLENNYLVQIIKLFINK